MVHYRISLNSITPETSCQVFLFSGCCSVEVDRDESKLYTPDKRNGDNKTNWTAFAIGVLATLFVISLRKVVGMRIVRFTIKQEQTFTLIRHKHYIEHEMQIKFTLSRLMGIINWLTFFPQKREPVTAEIKFKYNGQTKWPYRGIWADTGTIVTIVDDICIKSLIITTLYKDKWFPINEVMVEPLPNSFIVEVQLRSQRDHKPLGKPLQEEIIYEDGVLTKQGIIIK